MMADFLIAHLESDMRRNHTIMKTDQRVGLHRIHTVWFNGATGFFIGKSNAWLFMSESIAGPWKIIPCTSPCEQKVQP